MSQHRNDDIEYLKTVDTPTLSNAIECDGVRPRHEGFTPSEIRCFFPELGRMCGWAVTAQVETVTQSNLVGKENFQLLFEAIVDSPKPAVVAFQELGARPELSAHAGEVTSTIFRRLGAVGLVTDSAVRDVPEVRALGFHYFARGSVASHANFRIVRVSTPIQILGMVVRPGDLLHGDENGLIQIPVECLNGLRANIEAVRVTEKRILDFVRSEGFNVPELVRRFYH